MAIASMQVIAHRGASGYAPENTFQAFDLALEMGADSLETDIRAAGDGVLVLIHDASLDRTTTGSGPVAECSVSRLGMLDSGSWFGPAFRGERVPLFEDFLALYAGRIHLTLEIKAPGIEGEFARIIKGVPGLNRDGYTVTAFEADRLIKAKELLGGCVTGWLVNECSAEAAAACSGHGFSQICPHVKKTDDAGIRTARAAGLAVRVWGVLDDDDMERAVSLGVDGMTINHPDRLLPRLARGRDKP